jgi:hypothetical protein
MDTLAYSIHIELINIKLRYKILSLPGKNREGTDLILETQTDLGLNRDGDDTGSVLWFVS